MVELKNKILEKKELKNIDENILDKIISEQIKLNKSLYMKIESKNFNSKSKEFKEFVKIVRKKLREIYGLFTRKHLNAEKKEELLEKNDVQTILSSHLSTYERIHHYKLLYKTIFEITGLPNTILDLGCGYNPFSYEYLGCKPKYVASDISSKELEFIQNYFDKNKINGKTLQADLASETKEIKRIKADVTFCFKLLDTLEAQKRGSSKELIQSLNTKNVVVSFPNVTIGGKQMTKGERNWFLKIIQDIKHTSFVIGTEEFFVLNM